VEGKSRAKLLVVLLTLVCAAAVGGVVWYRSRPLQLDAQIRKLPVQDAVLLHIDFAALRAAGILQLFAGTKATEDPDYRKFVVDTGFDYQQDLNGATVSFAPSGNYMLVSGNFEWKKLRQYAEAHGGECYASTCGMPGSTAERSISFQPVQSGLMGLAVSPNPKGIWEITNARPGPAPEYPNAPIWVAVSGSGLKSERQFPSGTRMFAHAMDQAEYATLALAPEGDKLSANLNLRCRSAADATQIAAELNRVTGLLRDMIARENQKPNPADLSGVLTSGAFRADGVRVFGYWPIQRSFLENILNGGVS